MNYLVSPILYTGSSFIDIYTGLVASARKQGIDLELLPVKRGEFATMGLDNPAEYSNDCLRIIKHLITILKDNDRILFLDAFFPGLDVLEYALKRSGVRTNKIGLIHGSTFIPSDLYEQETWLRPFEIGWYGLLDTIVCPSKYFSNQFPQELQAKIIVLPWGLDENIKPQFSDKKIDVIFPHRFACDKGIEDLLRIVQAMPNVRFCITGIRSEDDCSFLSGTRDTWKIITKSKNVTFRHMESEDQHLETLRSSKILLSTAKQEGFGYAVFKAIQSGCIPVLPYRCCYPEFFPDKYLYRDLDEAAAMIYRYMDSYPEGYHAVSTSNFSFDPILNLLK